MSLRQHYLLVCVNRRPPGNPRGSCAERGSEAILTALKRAVAERGLAQEVARVPSCSCLDACEDGPCVLVEPEHFLYAHVTEADVPEIVEALAEGGRVERLVRPLK